MRLSISHAPPFRHPVEHRLSLSIVQPRISVRQFFAAVSFRLAATQELHHLGGHFQAGSCFAVLAGLGFHRRDTPHEHLPPLRQVLVAAFA